MFATLSTATPGFSIVHIALELDFGLPSVRGDRVQPTKWLLL